METNYFLYETKSDDKNLFKDLIKKGYSPFYFCNRTYELKEYESTSKTDYIFFLKGDAYEKIKKQTELLSEILKTLDEQKQIYLKYTAAIVKKFSEKK